MNSQSFLTTRLRRLLIFFVGLIILSVLGYMLIEGFTLLDATYMTVITLSTVGFGEVEALSPAGRVFTTVVILVGVGTVAYTLGTLGEYILAGELEGTLRRRRMNQKINALSEHYIVCGYGRVGQQVVAELSQLNLPYVVIEKEAEVAVQCREDGILYIEGDATDDEVLLAAGVQRSRALLSVLSEDAANVFVVLSARALNPDLIILARASSKEAEKKLYSAGASQTISPPVMAGYHMVSSLLRPNAMNFIETAIGSLNSEMWVEEVRISPDSELAGQNLGEAMLRIRTGSNVLAVIGGKKHSLINWSPELRMEKGDILIVLGKPDQIRDLAELAGDKGYLTRARLYRKQRE